jgi:hypothetical protein
LRRINTPLQGNCTDEVFKGTSNKGKGGISIGKSDYGRYGVLRLSALSQNI